MGERISCWMCGYEGVDDTDLHIAKVGDLIRNGSSERGFTEWVLTQLVDHRLHLAADRRD
jgi:hypothetical protein